MSALYEKYSELNSVLEKSIDVPLSIDGNRVIVEISYTAKKHSEFKSIYQGSVIHMVKTAFREIVGFENDKRFVIYDSILKMSLIGTIYDEGDQFVVTVIGVYDTPAPDNWLEPVTIIV